MAAETQLKLEKSFCSKMEDLNPYLELIRRQFDFFLQKKYQYFTHISFPELCNFSYLENMMFSCLGAFIGSIIAINIFKSQLKK